MADYIGQTKTAYWIDRAFDCSVGITIGYIAAVIYLVSDYSAIVGMVCK